MGWTIPEGFRFAAGDAGLTGGDRPDLFLAVADEPGFAEAAFTNNRIVAAPVALSRAHLRESGGTVRAILANAGCANAATGARGDEDAAQCARWVAELVGCDAVEVLLFSTGVIGSRLPLDGIEGALPGLRDELGRAAGAVETAARAIMTTDTRPKISEREVLLEDGSTIRVLGIAKGSGMIHPDMATMLAFLFTSYDAGQGADILLRGAVRGSFHHVSIDGDTSTNDAVLLWSTMRTDVPPKEEPAYFCALQEVSADLAKAIARDGEGARKLIEVRVTGARTPDDALRCAKTVGSSLLVRTAIYGEDPNWGRVLAAAGRARVELDTRKIRVGIGPACLFGDDEPHPDGEAAARAHLANDEVLVWVDLGAGECDASFWTCDLTPEYIRINADYRT